MSYFDDVYLKRINQYGNTLQERIQNKKEYDFEKAVLKKSPNQVFIREYSGIFKEEENYVASYQGVLQTKNYDEDEVVDYLLVPCSREISLGNLLEVTDIRHKTREKPFMAYAIDPYTSQGYNRYTVVELEEIMYWVQDGILHVSYVHATGGGSGARDKNINLKFRTQFSESGVYLPNKRYSIIMPTNSTLHKNSRVTLGDETWRVTGFDKISVNGVMYITLEEALTDETGDVPVADWKDIENWRIACDQGESFEISASSSTPITIRTYYKDVEQHIEIVPEITNGKDYFSVETGSPLKTKYYSQETFYITPKEGISEHEDGILNVKIKSHNNGTTTENRFFFMAMDEPQHDESILGPTILYMGDTKIYSLPVYTTSVSISDENILEIVEINLDIHKVTVKAKSIGSAQLLTIQPNITKTLSIDVQSPWLGGNTNVNP